MKLLIGFFTMLCLCTYNVSDAKEIKKAYYPNGQLQFEYHVTGVIFDGQFASFYQDGKQQSTGQFKGNQKTGVWKFWDNKGALRAVRQYTDNKTFIVIQQYHADGSLMTAEDIKALSNQVITVSSGKQQRIQTIYWNRLLVRIAPTEEIFGKGGLVEHLMKNVSDGTLLAYADERFVYAVKEKSLIRKIITEQATELMIKEQHYFSAENQTMVYKVVGIGMFKKDAGNEKEICWFYVPDVERLASNPALLKLINHEFEQTVESSTVKRDNLTDTKNEEIALKILEQEALTLIYVLNRHSDNSISIIPCLSR